MNVQDHDTSRQIVVQAVHDSTGWRVVLHIHAEDRCVTLEGHARFPDEQACHNHGHSLHAQLNEALGLVVKAPTTRGN